MPEHLRSLIVILALSPLVLVLARFATIPFSANEDFVRRRNLWLALTLVAFLAHNFWLCMVAAAILLWRATGREHNPVALYLFVLFCIPPLSADIPGLVVNYLFGLDFLRLLSLVVLLPAALRLYRDTDNPRPGNCLADKLIIAYVVYALFLIYLAATFTNLLRGCVLMTLDVLLPYYVASRGLRRPEAFRDALAGFVVGAGLLAAIGIFESSRGWVLYATLKDALGVSSGYFNVLLRDETQRATGTAGHPIAFGYVMTVAIGFWMYLQTHVRHWALRVLPLSLLVGALIATMSRGPWIGAFVVALVFAANSARPVKAILQLGLLAAVFTGLIALIPGGERLFDLLPFVGEMDSETVSYRQRLIEIFVPIILDNPLMGASSYLYSPELESLRQGQGIIDVVNTYIGIGLYNGVAGLVLFLGFFVAVASGVWRRMRGNPDQDARNLGRTLLAVLAGILVILGTVSSVTIIPYVYWTVAGIGCAYAFGITSQPVAAARPAIAVTRPVRTSCIG